MASDADLAPALIQVPLLTEVELLIMYDYLVREITDPNRVLPDPAERLVFADVTITAAERKRIVMSLCTALVEAQMRAAGLVGAAPEYRDDGTIRG